MYSEHQKPLCNNMTLQSQLCEDGETTLSHDWPWLTDGENCLCVKIFFYFLYFIHLQKNKQKKKWNEKVVWSEKWDACLCLLWQGAGQWSSNVDDLTNNKNKTKKEINTSKSRQLSVWDSNSLINVSRWCWSFLKLAPSCWLHVPFTGRRRTRCNWSTVCLPPGRCCRTSTSRWSYTPPCGSQRRPAGRTPAPRSYTWGNSGRCIYPVVGPGLGSRSGFPRTPL